MSNYINLTKLIRKSEFATAFALFIKNGAYKSQSSLN